MHDQVVNNEKNEKEPFYTFLPGSEKSANKTERWLMQFCFCAGDLISYL